MVKKINIKEKVQKMKTLPNKAKEIINDVFIGEKTYNKIANKFINAAKVFIVATRKFMADACPTKASSLAYTAIVSLIPTLTVLLTFYSIFSGVGDKKEEIFNNITTFMLEHNIKLNIEPMIEALSSLIENAGKIGGVGAVIMIFSATALLRTMESSLNEIWKVGKSRSIFLKIIYYWAALSLGPIIVISGTTLATQVTSVFASPNFKSAYISQDNIWVVGDKSRILSSDKSALNLSQLPADRIDFDNQKIYQYDASNKTFKEFDFKIEESEFKTFKFNDIQFINNNGWIVGKDGILLMTRDRGKTWSLNKFGSFGFNDLHMIDSVEGFIACDNGYLLSTGNGGYSWNIMEWRDIQNDLHSIEFFGKSGIICGDNGIILKTEDNGAKWEARFVDEAKQKKKYLNLNKSCFISETKIVLVGDEGTILMSDDSGTTWKRKKFLEKNYYGVYFSDGLNGYVAGEKGILISTDDGGETWHRMEISKHIINKIIPEGNTLWSIGDMGLVKKSVDNGKKWTGIQGGNFVLYLLNFLTPFVSIWLLFLLIYIALPNIKIPFKPGALGAAFTSVVWVIFILFFSVYVKSFAKGTLAIYGALAAIPIFLLMIYASSIIVLYGAEVSYTLMYPQLYRNIKKTAKAQKDIYIYNGIAVLHHIYKKFESGKGPSSHNELLKITSKSEELDGFLELFKNEKLVIEPDENTYNPANSSKNILLSDLLTLIHDVSLLIPGAAGSQEKFKTYIKELFGKITSSKDDIVKGITLADVIENS